MDLQAAKGNGSSRLVRLENLVDSFLFLNKMVSLRSKAATIHRPERIGYGYYSFSLV